MKIYTYSYLKFDKKSGTFLTYVDTVQAISFMDAEHLAKINHSGAKIIGQLYSAIDEKTGHKTDYGTFLNN